MKRKILVAGLLFGSVVLAFTPAAGAATPSNLIGHAEYNAVTTGMSLGQVQAVIAQNLTFSYESRFTLSKGEMVTQTWTFEGEFGDCWQHASFTFDNMDDNLNPGPFVLDSKYVSEFDCGGIIK